MSIRLTSNQRRDPPVGLPFDDGELGQEGLYGRVGIPADGAPVELRERSWRDSEDRC